VLARQQGQEQLAHQAGEWATFPDTQLQREQGEVEGEEDDQRAEHDQPESHAL